MQDGVSENLLGVQKTKSSNEMVNIGKSGLKEDRCWATITLVNK